MIVKRFLALSMAVLMLISLVACASSDEGTHDETTKKEHPIADVKKPEPYVPEEETIDDSLANYWVDLVIDGKAQYTIVSESKEYDETAQTLASKLADNTKAIFYVKKAAEKDSVTGKKISIGKDPSLVIDDHTSLTYKGALSLHVGKTIYLTGYSSDGVWTAVDKFAEAARPEYLKRNESGQVNFQAPDIRLFFLYNPPTYVNDSPTALGVPLSDFVIVTSETPNAAEHFMLKYLISNIGNRTGCVMKVVTDRTPKAAHEIVFGKTDREGSVSLYDTLPDEHFAIKSRNGSFYVAYDNYLVMEDASEEIFELVTGNSSEEINLLEKPDYASQLVKKENDYYVRVMTSNIICAGDATAVEKYDVNGVNCELRVGIQGTMMMDYLPDFVGMQEMQEGTVNGVKSLMRTELLKTVGSEYSFVNYPDLSAGNYWNPILYRHTVWQIEAQDVMNPENFDNGMHRWQWALFSKIDNPYQKCIVMNLHYPTGRYPDLQYGAAVIVNDKIKELQELYPNVPIFVTGDFNTRQGSEAFEATFAETDLVTANTAAGAIDHVVYDSKKAMKMGEAHVNNGYIDKSSDHRPYFVDLLF